MIKRIVYKEETDFQAQTEKLIQDIISRGVISEREMKLIQTRMNNKRVTSDIEEPFYDADILVDKDQTEKGFRWLYNLYKTPTGKDRLNMPYGYREQDILDNFDYMTFDYFYDAGRGDFHFYIPVYSAVGKNGNSFQYYVNGGTINIVG